MAETLEEALKEIEVDKARVILNEAKSGGFMDDDIPEDPEKIVELAVYWYTEAHKAYEAGMRHDTVVAILNAMGDEIMNERKWKPAVDVPNPGYSSGVPPRSSGGYSESDLRETKSDDSEDSVNVARDHKLPVPQDFDEEPEQMPRDISECTDRQIRHLSGVYNAYLARVKWLLAIETSDLANIAHLRDAAFRKSLKNVDKVDQETKKSKLKEVLDAEAKESQEYQKLDQKVKLHQERVVQFKALQEIYSGNIDRLSREWTMRQDEYEKTR